MEHPEREDKGEEWLSRQYRDCPRVPRRFFLSVGQLESERMRSSNARMRDALHEFGYPVAYTEFGGGHAGDHGAVRR